MILEIHGGPHSAYGNVFTHEFQWMAAKGYVVLYHQPARQHLATARSSATSFSTAIPATTTRT